MFLLALALALHAPGSGVAAHGVHMPSIGFRYATQVDMETMSTSDADSETASKMHSVLHRVVISSNGTTIETRNEGMMGVSGGELPISGSTTYRLFFLVNTELRVRAIPDQPPVTNSTTWNCPTEGLDQFYPRGMARQVSLACSVTGNVGGRVVGPTPVTVSFSDLGGSRDMTPAGAFDVRKLMVHAASAEMTNEITYDFAPALGISVVQNEKVSTSHIETMTHSEVSDFAPAP